MAKVESQRDQRVQITAEDQFGRVWSYAMEKETMDPTGQVSPGNWTDPMNTPAEKYMMVPPGKFGQKQLGTMSLDWRRWAADQDLALTDWKNGLFRIWLEVKKGLPFNMEQAMNDPDIQHVAGLGSWPSGDTIRYAFSKFGTPKDDDTAKSLRGQNLVRVDYAERPGKFSMVNKLTDEAKALLGIAGKWLDEAPVTVKAMNYHAFIKAKCGDGTPLADAQKEWRELKASV